MVFNVNFIKAFRIAKLLCIALLLSQNAYSEEDSSNVSDSEYIEEDDYGSNQPQKNQNVRFQVLFFDLRKGLFSNFLNLNKNKLIYRED